MIKAKSVESLIVKIELELNDMGEIWTGGSGDDYKAAEKTRPGFLRKKTWDRWYMNGNGGDDTLVGGPKDDALVGNDGNDNLSGGDGNDTLIGGAGSDFMEDGIGSDVFLYESTSDSTHSSPDTIAFTPGVDKIDLSKIDFGLAESYDFFDNHIIYSEGVIEVSNSDNITVFPGFGEMKINLTSNPLSISESDFIL